MGLLSMIMAMGALSIDVMLPAFSEMRAAFGLSPENTEVAQVVTVFLLGMALAQFFYGPLADRYGRKPVLYGGILIYGVGALGATLAPTLPLVLAARFVWGIGAAGPRVVTVSIVRDRYSGEEMSRAMSYIMAIFIMVPIVAPTIGAGLIAIGPWRTVFAFGIGIAVLVAAWARVLPETLHPEYRRPIDAAAIAAAVKETLTNRQTIGYTMAMTMTFGVFTSYLASSERVFGEIYDRADQFPAIFGGIAAAMGIAMLLNAGLVRRVGTRRMVHGALLGYLGGGGALLAVTTAGSGVPTFWAFLVLLALTLACHALLIPNFNTIAMLPMDRIAGTASAVIGTVSLAGGALLGSFLDRLYAATVAPLAAGFVGYGIAALGFVLWAERGRLFSPLVPVTTARPVAPRP
jgi:DHA1 family bicyclomycin/chloramphenicol resistance-like MFS transporter